MVIIKNHCGTQSAKSGWDIFKLSGSIVQTTVQRKRNSLQEEEMKWKR